MGQRAFFPISANFPAAFRWTIKKNRGALFANAPATERIDGIAGTFDEWNPAGPKNSVADFRVNSRQSLNDLREDFSNLVVSLLNAFHYSL